MEGWAVVHRHVADEITLLCDNHHREKTNGLLPVATVRAANAKPYNQRGGSTPPYSLRYSGDVARINIGSNIVTARPGHNEMSAVVIDDVSMIGFRLEDGHYLLSARLFDDQGNAILQIIDNELIFSTQPWDIRFEGRRLRINSAARNVFADIQFDPPGLFTVSRAWLTHNGVEILVLPEMLIIANNGGVFIGNTFNNLQVALSIGGTHSLGASGVGVTDVPRTGVDREQFLKYVHQVLREERQLQNGS